VQHRTAARHRPPRRPPGKETGTDAGHYQGVAKSMSRHIFEEMDAAVFGTLGDPGTYQAPTDDAPRPVTIFVDKDGEYFPDESGVAERRTEIGLLLSEVGR